MKSPLLISGWCRRAPTGTPGRLAGPKGRAIWFDSWRGCGVSLLLCDAGHRLPIQASFVRSGV